MNIVLRPIALVAGLTALPLGVAAHFKLLEPASKRVDPKSPMIWEAMAASTGLGSWLSPRPYVGIPDPHYPFHDRTVVITSCGRLCLYNKKINLSLSLAGQAVGVKEVESGIWLVSFMDYDLGYIDLEEKTLQPLENPFGPKVLPMS